MATQEIAIIVKRDSFSFRDACGIADLAMKYRVARTIVIDLKSARDATTAAFAQLVLLRRALLKTGRDLRLVNLTDRAAHLFGINRLADVLPCG